MRFCVADQSRQKYLKHNTYMWEFKSEKITPKKLKEICFEMRKDLHKNLLKDNLNKQQDRIMGEKTNKDKNTKSILAFFMSQYKEADGSKIGTLWSHNFSWISTPQLYQNNDKELNLPQRVHGAGITYATQLFKKLGIENEEENEERIVEFYNLDPEQIDSKKCYITTVLNIPPTMNHAEIKSIKDMSLESLVQNDLDYQLQQFKLKYFMRSASDEDILNINSKSFEFYKDGPSVLYAPITFNDELMVIYIFVS
jgi:hypothetical protein